MNKFGQKHTINRCLLYPLPNEQRQEIRASRSIGRRSSKKRGKSLVYHPYTNPHQDKGLTSESATDQNKFLVLGCHFGRSEKPFVYDVTNNKYTQFEDKELKVDMYRSNDVV